MDLLEVEALALIGDGQSGKRAIGQTAWESSVIRSAHARCPIARLPVCLS
jgi:hypothetical protein